MLPKNRSRARKASESAGMRMPKGLVWILKLTVSPSSSVQGRLSEFAVACRATWARLVTSVRFSTSHMVSAWPTFSTKYGFDGH